MLELFPFPDLTSALLSAIERSEQGEMMDPVESHRRVRRLYDWEDVAKRTERVGSSVLYRCLSVTVMTSGLLGDEHERDSDD